MATRSQKARMRRSYLNHRRTRVDKVGQMQLFSEARARVKYADKFGETLFGVEHYPDDCTGATDSVRRESLHEKARTFWPKSSKEKVEEVIRLLGDSSVDRHICLVNGRSIRVLLYWTAGKQVNMFWFFIEVNLLLHRVRKSKRYFSREGAMRAFDSNHIIYQNTTNIG